MTNSFIRTALLAILLIALQVWVFTPFALFKVATPVVYPVLLFFVPMQRGAISLSIFGFVLGSVIDYLALTPGLHASVVTLTAFLRHYLVGIIVDAQDNLEYLPMPSVLGSRSYILLLEVFAVHHLLLYLLAGGWHGDWLYSLLRLLAGYGLSLFLAFLVLLTFNVRLSPIKINGK